MELITCSNPQKDSITTFDTLCTSPQIQLLKILISFVPPPMQGMMAFYIKLMELNYTMKLLKNHRELSFCSEKADITKVYDEAAPYLPMQERARLKSMKDMMDNISNMKEMMDMVNSMKELFPEGLDMGNMTGMGDMGELFNMMNQFGGMNGPDQKSETTVDE